MLNHGMNDLPEPRMIVMLGTPFHDVTMEESFEWIARIIKRRAPAYLVTADLDFAIEAAGDVELQRILIEADLVLCDDIPLVWASRLTGHPLRERVAGPVLVPRMAERAAREGWRLFFLGGDPATAEMATTNLKTQFPGLVIAGAYSPPSVPLHEYNHADIAARIKAAKPDILLVAFGHPMQEKWIHAHYRELGVPCSIGIGATIDLLADKPPCAPSWIGRLGLGRTYRMLQKPGQLVTRYAKDSRFLIGQMLRERKAIRSNPVASGIADTGFAGSADNVEVLFWKDTIVTGTIGQLSRPTNTKPFIIDMSMVTMIDSGGLGHVLRTLRRAWALGVTGCLAAPSEKALSVFATARLDRVLPMANSMGGAHAMIKREQGGALLRPVVDAEEESMLLLLPQRIINDNAQNCATSAVSEWEKRPNLRILRLDLASTTFIDSSGLGFLIRCQRMVAERPYARMELLHIPPNVRNILKVSKLDKLLHLPD